MLSLLIAAPLLAPVSLEGASAVEVSIAVDATHFSARNHSLHPQVLLFRNVGQERVIARTLPAGGDVEWSFPRQALAGVQLEIVSIDPGGLRNSGTLALDQVFLASADAIWMQHGFEHPVTWLEFGGSFERQDPGPSMLPRALVDASGNALTTYGTESFNAGTHVPEPTPTPKPEDYGPPELEEEPLPPV